MEKDLREKRSESSKFDAPVLRLKNHLQKVASFMNGETNEPEGGNRSWAKSPNQSKCPTVRKTLVVGNVTNHALRFTWNDEDIYTLDGIQKLYCFGVLDKHLVWYKNLFCTCAECLF